MKKTFLPYLPAYLLKGGQWRIIYHQTNPTTGKRKRKKPTFELNRIKNIDDRLKTASAILEKLNGENGLLRRGFPFLIDFEGNKITSNKTVSKWYQMFQEKENEHLKYTNLVTAFEYVRDLKVNSTDRKHSKKAYTDTFNSFTKWLIKQGLEELTVGEFSKYYAIKYMDFWTIEKKVNNNTWNDRRSQALNFFSMLVDLEYLEINPFTRIKRKPKQKKIRRRFTSAERLQISAHIKENDEWLYYAILLLYYCFIRKSELRRLRFNMFDFSKGVINLPEDVTKNRKWDTVTIPKFLYKDFLKPNFIKNKANYLLFGQGFKPHPTKPCGESTLNEKHRRVLNKLNLYDGTISIYSWKDTGMDDVSRLLKPRDLQEQARHSSLEVTELYLHQSEVLEDIRNLEKRLI